MQEIKKWSSLLNELKEIASTIDKTSYMTAEALVVAAIDYVLSKEDKPLSEKDTNELETFLQFFKENSVNLPDVRRSLIQYISTAEDHDMKDISYIRRILIRAVARAELQGADEVTAEHVFSCIFSYPSEAILRSINKNGQSSEKTKGAPGKNGYRAEKEAVDSFLENLQQAKQQHQSFWAGSESEPSKETKKMEILESEDNGEQLEPECNENASAKDQIASLVTVVKNTREKLLQRVFGQDTAVSVFTNGFFQGELISLLDNERTRPMATFLFAGPPGVGKTYLAESAAKVLQLPFMRFDMSEYADPDSSQTMCGTEGVYRGSKEGTVTGFVKKNPKCILLFDEVEKAHLSVIHLFLQMLDAGRLADKYLREEISFVDTIVIFTTNAGKNLYEELESDNLSGLSRKVILKALEKDVNPANGLPYFPAALCSRFASGNVVMFNHMSAHTLRNIAKSVMERQIGNLENETGIKTDVDSNVYTSILLAEGGSVDARMIRGRALTFFNEELFELMRLVDSEKASSNIQQIEQIDIKVDLPEQKEIRELFETPADAQALVFAKKETVNWCQNNQSASILLGTSKKDEAVSIIHDKDIQFALIELPMLQEDSSDRFLNIEDIGSDARDLLWIILENYPEVPVFLLLDSKNRFSVEEQLSFRRNGIQGFIDVNGDSAVFADEMMQICEKLHQQHCIKELAKANKIVNYETGQRISSDGKTAEICLFDYELRTAVEAEDTKNVLSNLSKPDVHFSEVIGAEDAKKELQYFVKYLKDPKKFMGTGVSAPKGVLLYGPPGTGKTMLAKAMACEADVTFIAAEGNQFLKKYVGEGPAAVHDIFRAARKYAPSILFVDEIDAIAKVRTGSEQSEGREEILTSFLTEMDGFRVDPSKPVFVLAATNFDVDPGQSARLDPAILRRFDRRINVDLPNKEERILFLELQIAKNPVFSVSHEMVENIAIRSTGMSLAALTSAIELSLRMAIQDGSMSVTDSVFEDAFETFNSGEVKKWDISELERTARHEAGHAYLSWQSGDKPSYVTIVARADHGGYMQHGDNEQKSLYTKEDLLARIRTALGGRAAEIVYYGEEAGLSTGASGDLQTATQIAKRIVCNYGMDEEIGLAVIDQSEVNLPEIRKAVNRILQEEMDRAIADISDNRGKIDNLVNVLLEKNRLTGSEIEDLFS